MPDESIFGKTFRIAYRFVCGNHPNQRFWHFQWLAVAPLHKTFRKILPNVSGRVLDVGCGDKPYRNWFERVTEHVGLDVINTGNADIVVSADESWPIEDKYFDCIFSSEVLEHVENLELTISEIMRVLKPDGRIILALPFLYNEHGSPFDFRRFTKHSASQLFPGYEVQSVITLGGIGSTLGLLFLNWAEQSANQNKISRLLKGVLLPLWIVICALINAMGALVDLFDRTESYYNNLIIVLKKPDPAH